VWLGLLSGSSKTQKLKGGRETWCEGRRKWGRGDPTFDDAGFVNRTIRMRASRREVHQLEAREVTFRKGQSWKPKRAVPHPSRKGQNEEWQTLSGSGTNQKKQTRV